MRLLEVAKQGETREQVYPVFKDDEAKRVAAAWVLCHPKYEDPQTVGTIPHECFTAAWNQAQEPDWALLASLSGVPAYEAREAFSRLKSAALVYPDGSIHQVLMSILRAEIGAHIRGILPRGLENPKPSPSETPKPTPKRSRSPQVK